MDKWWPCGSVDLWGGSLVDCGVDRWPNSPGVLGDNGEPNGGVEPWWPNYPVAWWPSDLVGGGSVAWWPNELMAGGSVVSWVCDSMALWICGSVILWSHDPRILGYGYVRRRYIYGTYYVVWPHARRCQYSAGWWKTVLRRPFTALTIFTHRHCISLYIPIMWIKFRIQPGW